MTPAIKDDCSEQQATEPRPIPSLMPRSFPYEKKKTKNPNNLGLGTTENPEEHSDVRMKHKHVLKYLLKQTQNIYN